MSGADQTTPPAASPPAGPRGAGPEESGVGLGVVVVSYGSSDLLGRHLRPTAAQLPDAVVVVVDNFSTVQERERVAALCAAEGWVLHAPDQNLGFGGGVNAGARVALDRGVSALLLLNPDASLDAVDVGRLRARVADGSRRVVSPVVVRPDGSRWFSGSDLHLDSGLLASTRRRDLLPPGPVEPWLSGAVLLLTSQLWQELGGFDERYFLYWEDVDLSHRILASGGELEVVEDARAVHDEGGTHTAVSAGKSDLYYYYNVRNRLLFAALHLPSVTARRWERSTGAAAREILGRGGRRQYLQRGMAPVAAAARGARDGRRLLKTLGRTDRRLVVLQSFPAPRPTTNPYISMLAEHLRQDDGLDVRTFTWREALVGRPDVFHAHWPENLVAGPSAAKRAVKQALFAVAMTRWRAQGTAIVRTRHNVDLPTGLSRRARWLLGRLERHTDLVIRLNPHTAVPDGQAVRTIVHGHYRPWFSRYTVPPSRPGRLAYVGLVRRYKGLDALVSAFHRLEDPSASITISGKPSSADLAAELESAAARDDRIELDLRFLSEAELVRAVGESVVVALPYPEMHNSGTALLSLSLGRPVLVPDNEVNQALADEVGPGWVHLFRPPLSPDHLAACLDEGTRGDRPEPDLSGRDWGGVAQEHAQAYRLAVDVAQRRRASRSATP